MDLPITIPRSEKLGSVEKQERRGIENVASLQHYKFLSVIINSQKTLLEDEPGTCEDTRFARVKI